MNDFHSDQLTKALWNKYININAHMYSTKINDIVQIQHSKCEMIITLEKSFKDYLILNEPRLII